MIFSIGNFSFVALVQWPFIQDWLFACLANLLNQSFPLEKRFDKEVLEGGY